MIKENLGTLKKVHLREVWQNEVGKITEEVSN